MRGETCACVRACVRACVHVCLCVQTYSTRLFNTLTLQHSCAVCVCLCMLTVDDIRILDFSDCGLCEGFICELTTAHEQLIKVRRTEL